MTDSPRPSSEESSPVPSLGAILDRSDDEADDPSPPRHGAPEGGSVGARSPSPAAFAWSPSPHGRRRSARSPSPHGRRIGLGEIREIPSPQRRPPAAHWAEGVAAASSSAHRAEGVGAASSSAHWTEGGGAASSSPHWTEAVAAVSASCGPDCPGCCPGPVTDAPSPSALDIHPSLGMSTLLARSEIAEIAPGLSSLLDRSEIAPTLPEDSQDGTRRHQLPLLPNGLPVLNAWCL